MCVKRMKHIKYIVESEARKQIKANAKVCVKTF